MSVSILNTDANILSKTLLTAEGTATQTGLITFDRDPNPPFAVTAASTVVANLDADKVDGADYSTGTFTPTLVSSGGGVPTYTGTTGYYVTLGNLVIIELRLAITAFNTLAAGTLTIESLPFACNAAAHGTVTIPFWGPTNTALSSLTGYVFAGTQKVLLNYVLAAGSTTGNTQLTKADITATFDVVVTGVYLK
jgi:hypothetical protein